MDTTDSSSPDIPLDSPARAFLKRGLPAFLSSTYLHGHLSGKPRSRSQQRAFELKKARVLEDMDASQIESTYQETVGRIMDLLEQNRKENEETDRKIENLKKSRETEIRVISKMMQSQGNKSDRQDEDTVEKSDSVMVKEEVGERA